jgi:prefoldin subunit 5
MVVQEENELRRGRLNTTLKDLVYRRLQLTREIEDLDRNIVAIEGALNENEATRRDISTEEAIKQTKPTNEEVS